MKYFLLMSSILLLPFSADAEFVRKEKRPEFFVPESAFSRQEKLPEITTQKSTTKQVSNNNNKITSCRNNRITRPVAEEPAKPQKLTKNSSIETTKHDMSPTDDVTQRKFKEMQKTPEYQKKYDEYFDDINKLKRTGYLPANPSLQKDLMKMDGSERAVP
jgi:hypothetical protein